MSKPFTRADIERITDSPEGLRFLWYTFLDDSREPFHDLCYLLSKGKGFAEPSSPAQRRNATGCLFASFAGIKLEEEELPPNVAISISDVSAGLQTISEKWSEYSLEQLLSVSLLLDLSGEGSVSYEDFLNFAQLSNDSLKQDPYDTRNSFGTYYDCLRERIRGSLTGDHFRESINILHIF